jgi:nicotinamide mononucleotide (NMN) deamidase PncC
MVRWDVYPSFGAASPEVTAAMATRVMRTTRVNMALLILS